VDSVYDHMPSMRPMIRAAQRGGEDNPV
jgi:hypothetical protein